MSTKLSSATALHEVRSASAVSGTGVSKGGPNESLGSTVIANAEAGSDRVLYYVDAAGAPIAASGPLYRPAATDVAVTVPEASGDQTWVYVKTAAGAPGTLQRGNLVALSAEGLYSGVVGAAAGEPVQNLAGVAQHNIGPLQFGWILVKGHGVALVDTVADGDSLSVDAAVARSLETSGAGQTEIGLALEAGGAAAVIKAKLDI
tara:strand:- start:15175 stop:15786 length:612 start_codon:yes stop_codon:yes gene_type:complete